VISQLENIDEYIAGFPPEVQVVLEQIRTTIRAAAPDATETIKYGMPTFVQYGNLIYFAAFQKHIGLYPTPSGIEAFKAELIKYDQSKGTIRFAFGTPVPLELIARIVKFRLEENLRKALAKSKKKPKLTKTL
jgi:uncharacterized protein YdhG (YjbR/CyaY superfamily)